MGARGLLALPETQLPGIHLGEVGGPLVTGLGGTATTGEATARVCKLLRGVNL